MLESILLLVLFVVAIIVLLRQARSYVKKLEQNEEKEVFIKPKSFQKNVSEEAYKTARLNDHVESVIDDKLKPDDLKALGKSKASYNKRRPMKP